MLRCCPPILLFCQVISSFFFRSRRLLSPLLLHRLFSVVVIGLLMLFLFYLPILFIVVVTNFVLAGFRIHCLSEGKLLPLASWGLLYTEESVYTRMPNAATGVANIITHLHTVSRSPTTFPRALAYGGGPLEVVLMPMITVVNIYNETRLSILDFCYSRLKGPLFFLKRSTAKTSSKGICKITRALPMDSDLYG